MTINRRNAETATPEITKHGPRNGAKVETRDLKNIAKTPKHRQHRGIFGPDRNMKTHNLSENRGKNGPTTSQKRAKVENRDLKKMERHQITGKIGVFSDRAEI